MAGWYIRRRSRALPGPLGEEEWGAPVVRWRDLEAISDYHRRKVGPAPAAVVLDDRTWNDLHFDSVFAAIDRTRSTIGQQVLYHRLRSAPSRPERDRFEHLVQYFGTHQDARLKAQGLLGRLTHSSGYRLWYMCQPDGLDVRPWYWAFPVLAVGALTCVLVSPFWPRVLLPLLAIFAVNMALRVKLASRVFHMMDPFRQVAPLLEAAGGILATPAVSEAFDAEPLGSDMAAVHSLKRTARWASRNDTMENELVGSAWEYLNDFFLADANATLLAARTLREQGASLLRIVEALGEVDAAISAASLRASGAPWTALQFTADGESATIGDAWHPLLSEPVANSVVLQPGRGLIITGSNMSGKSTFLRTIGVTVVLAQTINTCPARAYSGPLMRVRSAMERADDLESGRSYYLVEVDAVLDLLRARAEAEQHLFLFDEIFRGANTVERLAAGEAVLRTLLLDPVGAARHVVLAATHDRELVDLLQGVYDPVHFEEEISPSGIDFAYKLEPGPARTRTAIALLELRGASPDLTRRARRTITELDRTNGTPPTLSEPRRQPKADS